jgi:hypothetical protein
VFLTSEDLTDSQWMQWVEEALDRSADVDVTVIDVNQEEVGA